MTPPLAWTALVAACALAPDSFDWPQWQGPHRDEICRETGLLHKWPEAGPPLLWKATGLGEGYSTPSVAGGRMFTMGNVGGDERVMALDANSEGKQLWSTVVGPVRSRGGDYPGPRCTPTVDGDLVYALGIMGDLLCLETATGKVRWRKSLRRDFGGEMMSIWGFSESPLIDGDKLICTPGGPKATLAALNKLTGDVIWQARVPGADKAAYSSVVVAEVDGLRQYVQLVAKGVIGVDARDGRFLWRYDRMANRVANIPTPLVRGNLVFCSTDYGAGSALVRLTREGENVRAEEVYFTKAFQNHHGGFVLVGEYVYGGHGQNQGVPTCLKFDTGEIVWQQKRSPGEGSAAVLFADGALYLRYQNGLMVFVEATPAGYQERSRFNLPDQSGKPSWPHPVIAGGRMYIRDQDTLLCFDVKQH